MRTFVIAALFASASALSLTQLQYLSEAPACKEGDKRPECAKAAAGFGDDKKNATAAAFAAPDCKEGDKRPECAKAAAFGDDKAKNATEKAF